MALSTTCHICTHSALNNNCAATYLQTRTTAAIDDRIAAIPLSTSPKHLPRCTPAVADVKSMQQCCHLLREQQAQIITRRTHRLTAIRTPADCYYPVLYTAIRSVSYRGKRSCVSPLASANSDWSVSLKPLCRADSCRSSAVWDERSRRAGVATDWRDTRPPCRVRARWRYRGRSRSPCLTPCSCSAANSEPTNLSNKHTPRSCTGRLYCELTQCVVNVWSSMHVPLICLKQELFTQCSSLQTTPNNAWIEERHFSPKCFVAVFSIAIIPKASIQTAASKYPAYILQYPCARWIRKGGKKANVVVCGFAAESQVRKGRYYWQCKCAIVVNKLHINACVAHF